MLMTFANGIQPMSAGFFTSIGKAKLGIIMSLTRQVLFLLPLIVIFPLFLELTVSCMQDRLQILLLSCLQLFLQERNLEL